MNKIDKRQIPCGCSINCGSSVDLMKNLSFCDVLATGEDFIQPYSKLHRESTTFSQLAMQSEKIEKVADTMRMFSPRRRSRVNLFNPDRGQK